MNIFDIIGPVMVGPSSSHTAGAVRIGKVARELLGEEIMNAEILLFGSFLATGKGHGTDKAIVAGLLGFDPDDRRIPESLDIAKARGMQCRFGSIDLGDAHPNSAKLHITSVTGKKLDITAASVGGGRINVTEIDGVEAHFSAECPTLIVRNDDKPGLVANVTALLQKNLINIATMQLYRSGRGDHAVMVIECDEQVPAEAAEELKGLDGINEVIYYRG